MWPGRTGEERGKGRHSSPGDVRGQEWASVHLLGSCCPPSYNTGHLCYLSAGGIPPGAPELCHSHQAGLPW